MWFVYALLSAIFAALTSILAKVGIDGVNSNLATAIRTVESARMAVRSMRSVMISKSIRRFVSPASAAFETVRLAQRIWRQMCTGHLRRNFPRSCLQDAKMSFSYKN